MKSTATRVQITEEKSMETIVQTMEEKVDELVIEEKVKEEKTCSTQAMADAVSTPSPGAERPRHPRYLSSRAIGSS